MKNDAEKVSVVRFSEEGRTNTERMVATEFSLTIVLNGQEVVTLLCSPKDTVYLAAGYLFSEGLLSSKGEIKNITVDEQNGTVRVETKEAEAPSQKTPSGQLIASSGGRGAPFADVGQEIGKQVDSRMEIYPDEVSTLVSEFQQRSSLYLSTHGVHSAALCDRKNILVFSDDIGRHNAIDKIFGKCLMEGISTDDRAVITSGRISSEILRKAARRGIPIMTTIASPTAVGVEMAKKLGITLIGNASGKGMNVYANDWRLVTR